MKKIGLLGGSFDPIHIGHVAIAEAAKMALAIDFVIFIPASCSPFKSGSTVSDKDRMEMVRLALLSNPDFLISDYEIKKGGKSFTFETVTYIKSQYPDDKLFLILGDEAYSEMGHWKNPEIIAANCDFAVVTRDNKGIPKNAHYIKMNPVNVSSTEIRKRLRKGKSCSTMLDSHVLSYIEKNNLYKE